MTEWIFIIDGKEVDSIITNDMNACVASLIELAEQYQVNQSQILIKRGKFDIH